LRTFSVVLPKVIDMNLFVVGLPYDLDDAELMEIFEKFGTVTSAKVAMDKETGKSRGFGFVDMPVDAEAKDAMESLTDISLGKKPLVVKEASERSGPSGGGGFRGGNSGGGGGYRGGNSGGGGGNRGGYNDRPRPGGDRGGYNDRNNNDRDRNRY
jgi:RNA recognition motif-containing protein